MHCGETALSSVSSRGPLIHLAAGLHSDIRRQTLRLQAGVQHLSHLQHMPSLTASPAMQQPMPLAHGAACFWLAGWPLLSKDLRQQGCCQPCYAKQTDGSVEHSCEVRHLLPPLWLGGLTQSSTAGRNLAMAWRPGRPWQPCSTWLHKLFAGATTHPAALEQYLSSLGLVDAVALCQQAEHLRPQAGQAGREPVLGWLGSAVARLAGFAGAGLLPAQH